MTPTSVPQPVEQQPLDPELARAQRDLAIRTLRQISRDARRGVHRQDLVDLLDTLDPRAIAAVTGDDPITPRIATGLAPAPPPVAPVPSRQAQAINALQELGLVDDDGNVDLVDIVQARAENIAQDAGIDAASLDRVRAALTQRAQIQAAPPLPVEPTPISALEDFERRQTELEELREAQRPQQAFARNAALSELVDLGFAEPDIDRDEVLVDVIGAFNDGHLELLLQLGFSEAQIRALVNRQERLEERLDLLGLEEQAQERERIRQENLITLQGTLQSEALDDRTEAVATLIDSGHLQDQQINVVQAVIDGVPETTLIDAGVSSQTIDAIQTLEEGRLLTPEGGINAILAFQLAEQGDEGLDPLEVEELLLTAGLSPQDVSNARALARQELPATIGTVTPAPIRTFEPRTRVQLQELPPIPDVPGIFPERIEDVGIPTGGTGLTGVAGGIPLGRGVSRAALIAAIATIAVETARQHPELIDRLPSITRERDSVLERDPIPGFDVRQPAAVREIQPAAPRVPVLGGFDLSGQLPKLGDVPAPKVERVLNLAIDAETDAADINRDIETDPGLTAAERAALAEVARRVQEEDISVAVNIQDLIDQILAEQALPRRSGYARELEELRAKQRAFQQASEELVASQGFAPQTATIPAALGESIQREIEQAETDTEGLPATTVLTTPELAPATIATGVQPATSLSPELAIGRAVRTAPRRAVQLGDLTDTRVNIRDLTQPAAAPLPITGTATLPQVVAQQQTAAQPQTVTPTATRPATRARTATRATTRPIPARAVLPRVTAPASTRIGSRVVPPFADLPDPDDQTPFDDLVRFLDSATWQQGVVQTTIDMDTGRRTYRHDPAERHLTPEQTFRPLGFDDDPPQQRRIRMGIMDVVVGPDGLEYFPNELAAQRKPRKRNPFRSRGL